MIVTGMAIMECELRYSSGDDDVVVNWDEVGQVLAAFMEVGGSGDA